MADNKVNSGLLEFSEDQKVFVALDAETSEVKKAVTIDGDGVETDIAGGGGGSVTVEALSVTENGTYSEEGKAYSPVTVNVENLIPLKTVTVTAHYDETGATPTNIEYSRMQIYKDDKYIADLLYDDIASMPVSMLGNINSIKIPVYNDPNGKTIPYLIFNDNDHSYIISEVTINSGDASDVGGNLLIAGDCDITLKLELDS